MIYSLDPWVRKDLATEVESEIFALVNELERTGSQQLERFELRGQPCGPIKVRLSARNEEDGSGRPPADYGNARLWKRSPLYETLPATRELLESFPLEVMARILILIDPAGWGTPVHRDHQLHDVVQEFIWFRTSPNKQLYVINDQEERTDVASSAVWFDSRFRHGVEPSDHPTISIRADGLFSKEIRGAMASHCAAFSGLTADG